MARAEMIARYGNEAYVDGYIVHTTIDGRLQQQAQHAVERGLLAYDTRHGFRGAEARLEGTTPGQWLPQLARIAAVAGLEPAVVTHVGEREIDVLTARESVRIGWERGLSAARRHMSPDYRGPSPKSAAELVAPGDVVRITADEQGWRLSQLPDAQAALVSLDASDGAIRALVGGLDFDYSKFNRVAQARRQPGSNIKPFIYAAAMENGFTPASVINDAPIVFHDPGLEKVWRPENDSGKFYGPTSLRTALVNSRNLVSIRLLQQLGVARAVDYLSNLGFERADLVAQPLARARHAEPDPAQHGVGLRDPRQWRLPGAALPRGRSAPRRRRAGRARRSAPRLPRLHSAPDPRAKPPRSRKSWPHPRRSPRLRRRRPPRASWIRASPT
jgi:penicillin-binding protein 1A